MKKIIVPVLAVVAFATTTTGRLLAANGSWSLNMGSGNYTVTMSTYSPFGSRSWAQGMKTYCITTGTNITGKVVLSQCK